MEEVYNTSMNYDETAQLFAAVEKAELDKADKLLYEF